MSIQKLAIEFTKNKDEATFVKLQKRLTPGINKFLYNYVKDKENREYIIQNTFINIWTKIHQYNPDFAFSTWAYRIARNEALLSKRWAKRNKSQDFACQVVENSLMNEISYEPTYDSFDNDSDKDFDTVYNFIITEMKNLGKETSKIMIMREIKKMKYQDIAAELDMKISSVKTRIRIGRAKLAKLAKSKYPTMVENIFSK